MAPTRITGQQVKDTGLTDADFAAANIDGVAGTASLRTLGTGAQQACAGNDLRLLLQIGATRNINFSVAVASNVLTVNVVGDNGSALSSSNAGAAKYRGTTVTDTAPTLRSFTSGPASLSTVVGASLGARSGSTAAFRYWVLLFDNAGSPAIGLINCVKFSSSIVTDIVPIFPNQLMNTVPISASSTSAGVVYSNAASSATVTITNASPAVVTWTAHGLAAGTPVIFSTSGSLPTGITAGTTYYVIATGLTTNTFRISIEPGGAAVNTSTAGSGTHTCLAGLYQKAFAVLGWVQWDGLVTAGTFASGPTECVPWMPGVPLPGQIVWSHDQPSNITGSSTASVPNDNTRMQITEGDQWLTFNYYPVSRANVRELSAAGFGGNNPSNHAYAGIFEAGNALAIASGWTPQSSLVQWSMPCPKSLFDTVAKQTYSLRVGPTTGGTYYQNDYAGGGYQAGGMWTVLKLVEYQG